MSDAVYPVLPGLSWPVKRTPLWRTRVQTSASGREFRQALTTVPRYRYSLPYEFLRNEPAFAEFQGLFGFFNARRGSYDTFLFDDLSDNTATAQSFGVGDGVSTQFQLTRAVGGFAEPVLATNGPAVISVNGTPWVNLLVSSGGFEVDTNGDGLANGWSAYSNGTTGTITRSIVAGNGSAAAQRVASTGLGASAADQIGIRYTNDVNAAPGQTYVLSADTRDSGTGVRLHVDWYTAGASYISSSSQLFAFSGASWTRRVSTMTAPALTAVGRIYIWAENAVGGPVSAQIDIDNAQFQPSPSTAFADGIATVAASTGLVTFSSPPPVAAALTWSGKFYWRCRFDTDEMSFEQFMQQFWRTGEVRLITVKP